jgi:transposase
LDHGGSEDQAGPAAAVLRRAAKAERGARRCACWLIANALSGMSREAAKAAGMDRQTLGDWVIRYNEHGLDGLYDRWGDGRPPRLTAQEQAELIGIVLPGCYPETTSISAYTHEDLVSICEERFGKTFHPPRWAYGRAPLPAKDCRRQCEGFAATIHGTSVRSSAAANPGRLTRRLPSDLRRSRRKSVLAIRTNPATR